MLDVTGNSCVAASVHVVCVCQYIKHNTTVRKGIHSINSFTIRHFIPPALPCPDLLLWLLKKQQHSYRLTDGCSITRQWKPEENIPWCPCIQLQVVTLTMTHSVRKPQEREHTGPVVLR